MSLIILDAACIAYLAFAAVYLLRNRKLAKYNVPGKRLVLSDFVLGGIVPIIIAACMSYFFIFVGASPTAQFNAGDSSLMDTWSMWVGLLKLFALLVIVNTLGCIIWVIACASSYKYRPFLGPALFSLLLACLLYYTISSFAPTA